MGGKKCLSPNQNPPVQIPSTKKIRFLQTINGIGGLKFKLDTDCQHRMTKLCIRSKKLTIKTRHQTNLQDWIKAQTLSGDGIDFPQVETENTHNPRKQLNNIYDWEETKLNQHQLKHHICCCIITLAPMHLDSTYNLSSTDKNIY